jgi:hypothetical protein
MFLTEVNSAKSHFLVQSSPLVARKIISSKTATTSMVTPFVVLNNDAFHQWHCVTYAMSAGLYHVFSLCYSSCQYILIPALWTMTCLPILILSMGYSNINPSKRFNISLKSTCRRVNSIKRINEPMNF